ncbi:MAG: efflux RND transporter periplasmic adaptor subunit [Sedimentisphaerales bacterium]|nr:efflux RND transporter periplasmic adaptor subunit [Sedimentisphaerales bacterium]
MDKNITEKECDKKIKRSALAVKALLIIIVVVGLIGAGAFAFFRSTFNHSDNPASDPATYSVARRDLPITVTENGDIKSIDSVDIKSEVKGRTKIISIVDEGTYITPEDVNNGKILVELDSSEVEEQLTQQEISFLSAEASFTDANESLEIQKKENESDIVSGKTEVRFTLMDFKKYLGETVAGQFIEKLTKNPSTEIEMASLIDHAELGGEAMKRLTELRNNITEAKSKLERATDELFWTRKLYEKKYVAETDLKADELEVESLNLRLEQHEIALNLFRLYEFPKEAEKLFRERQEAERELARKLARARSRLAQAEARLASSKATYMVRKKRVEDLQKQLEACTIKAPAAGQVVYASSMDDRMRQRNPIEGGAEIRERQRIISIPDMSQVKVEIKVHEIWVDKVRLGQKAKITVAAFLNIAFTGEVLKKAPLATQDSWFNPDLKAYATDVRIDGTHDYLKTGMSAKVEILIEQLNNVIVVPIQCVVNVEDEKYCYVKAAKGTERRQVETGSFNDSFVEIKTGLLENEEVLLNPPRLTEIEQSQKKGAG